MASKVGAYWRADPTFRSKLKEIAPCSPDVYYFLEELSDKYDIYCATDMIKMVSSNNQEVLDVLLKITYSGLGNVKIIKR